MHLIGVGLVDLLFCVVCGHEGLVLIYDKLRGNLQVKIVLDKFVKEGGVRLGLYYQLSRRLRWALIREPGVLLLLHVRRGVIAGLMVLLGVQWVMVGGRFDGSPKHALLTLIDLH